MPRILPDGRIVQRAAPSLIIPPSGSRRLADWIAGFLDYTDQAESPLPYLQWVALATVAGAAQRKIYMDMLYFTVPSNMYVVLVGPPGSKKTTAIRQGKKLLAKVPGINLTSDAPSVAGIMQEFSEIPNPAHQSLNAFIYEMSSLYENAKDSMSGFLTAIYDGDDDYIKRTRVGGKEHITAPWLHLVAGTTPTWLADNLSRAALEGGLVARTLYIYSDEIILKSSRPKRMPHHERLREDLAHDLAHISALSGEFDFEGGENGEAFQWFDAWYLDKRRIPQPYDNRTHGYFIRKPIHLLKVAMALALARGDRLVLDKDTLLLAKAFLESIEPGMKKALAAVGGNRSANDLERIENQIAESGKKGIAYADLLAANMHAVDKKMLDAILESLIAMGTVEQKVTIGGGNVVDKRFYPTEW